jgi:hypothetical protein
MLTEVNCSSAGVMCGDAEFEWDVANGADQSIEWRLIAWASAGHHKTKNDQEVPRLTLDPTA